MEPDPIYAWVNQPIPRSLEGLPSALAVHRRLIRRDVFLTIPILLVVLPLAYTIWGLIGMGVWLGVTAVATAALWRKMVGMFEHGLRTATVQPYVVHATRRVKMHLGGKSAPIAGLELDLRTERSPPLWAYLCYDPPLTAEVVGASVGILRWGKYGALVTGLASGVYSASVSETQNTQLQEIPA